MSGIDTEMSLIQIISTGFRRRGATELCNTIENHLSFILAVPSYDGETGFLFGGKKG